MNISAGNNVNVAGSNVVSENNLNLEAGNNVVISSALEGSSQHHESVKTGFLKDTIQADNRKIRK